MKRAELIRRLSAEGMSSRSIARALLLKEKDVAAVVGYSEADQGGDVDAARIKAQLHLGLPERQARIVALLVVHGIAETRVMLTFSTRKAIKVHAWRVRMALRQKGIRLVTVVGVGYRISPRDQVVLAGVLGVEARKR